LESRGSINKRAQGIVGDGRKHPRGVGGRAPWDLAHRGRYSGWLSAL
jgi:hypothetical protein